MRRVPFLSCVLVALVCAKDAPPLEGQLPLGTRSGRGQTVTPAYEGWYPNEDGTISISFGYMNRNFEEVVDIPLGPDNMIEPAQFQGAQPTQFTPRRHFGVFVVRVPADFGEEKVYWTLNVQGETFRVPGHLNVDWQIDALKGEAGSGNEPPTLKFGDAPEGAGPAGAWGETLTAKAGEAFSVSVWAQDDGVQRGNVRSAGAEAAPVDLTWFKHQGPGEVEFGERVTTVPSSGGEAMTPVMFSEPGDYILRVRANDASGVASAGHAQCCWTNGFVRVTVTP